MGFAVCMGATTLCTFGVGPSVLNVLPVNRVVTHTPLANIMDNKPIINVVPFPACVCSGTPTPCIPSAPGPWTPGSPTVLIAGQPALNNTSKLMCARGGVISIIYPGTTNIMVP